MTVHGTVGRGDQVSMVYSENGLDRFENMATGATGIA
jgi:hypothetical protein